LQVNVDWDEPLPGGTAEFYYVKMTLLGSGESITHQTDDNGTTASVSVVKPGIYWIEVWGTNQAGAGPKATYELVVYGPDGSGLGLG